ncbi:MAG: hypothetical protein KDJ49_02955 [Alphaproteobacteria bacterium]|nr:hypothetical protein [Alphaproteobacteria bacterium]
MDEIKQRLKDASDACIATYEAWRAKANDHSAREASQEAVHELRKVAARLEIDLAVSDRKAQGSEPIPIPAHRAARRQGAQEAEGDDGNRGNRQSSGNPGGRGGQGAAQGGAQGSGRPVQIRRAPEGDAAASIGNDAPSPASGGEEEGGKKRPLSLRRGSTDSE